MTSKEIHEECDREKLLKRLYEPDVRKKERRLLLRKIIRLERLILVEKPPFLQRITAPQ